MKQEKNLTVINLIAIAQLFHECLDELEDTPYYKQGIKRATRNMQIELSKVMDKHIAHLWDVDGETMQEVQVGVIEVMKELATMNPAKIAAIGEMLKNKSLIFEEIN